MEVQEDPLLDSIYEALAHEVRRDILRLVGSFNHISYTDIISYLHIKPGSFFFHVKKMTNFLTQNEQKEYILTSEGVIAYKMLLKSEDSLSSDSETKTGGEKTNSIIEKHTIILTALFGRLFRNFTVESRTIVCISGLSLIECLLLIIAELGSLVPFYLDNFFYYGPWWVIPQFVFLLILEWCFIEIFVYFLSPLKHLHFSSELLLALPVSKLPLFLYAVFLVIVQGILGIILPDLVQIFILLALQTYMGFILAEIIHTYKLITFENALLIIILLLYLSSTIAFVLIS